MEGLTTFASADEIFSWKSPSARAYAASRGRLSESELIDLMLSQPRLIRRPMVVRGSQIVIGLDEKAIRALLSAPATSLSGTNGPRLRAPAGRSRRSFRNGR
ncbi:MAG: hypothetical protein HYY34_02125 [Chloroflexi bacterium]|nr:hypothetical protein [Chloroflexota bacterium]